MKHEEKFQLEKHASKVVVLLLEHDGDVSENYLCFMCGIDESELEDAMFHLIGEGLVYKSTFDLTEDGILHARAILKDSSFDTLQSTIEFKNEALTGITEERGKAGGMVTRKSKLTRAALPNGGNKKGKKGSSEREIEERDTIRRGRESIAKRLKVTTKEVTELIESGQLKICSHCGDLEMHDKDGKYFKTPCRKCRKRQREEKKK